MLQVKRFVCFSLLGLLALAVPVQAEMEIPCVKVKEAPTLDGRDQEVAWKGVRPVAIMDQASGKNILFRSVRTDDEIFFFVQFPDPANNILHKPWVWDAVTKQYQTGPHREDTFIFKWNMMDKDVDLSTFADNNYETDVWYWKANRTNPAGYADDKRQLLADEPSKKSAEVISASGKKRYLSRKSDAGTPPYLSHKPTAFEGELVDAFPAGTPDGSRADVHAKGQWNGGLWFIEFSRKLDTGHADDVKLDPKSGQSPLFGVSIFSLYGKSLDTTSPNLYGMGRISEPLRLIFK